VCGDRVRLCTAGPRRPAPYPSAPTENLGRIKNQAPWRASGLAPLPNCQSRPRIHMDTCPARAWAWALARARCCTPHLSGPDRTQRRRHTTCSGAIMRRPGSRDPSRAREPPPLLSGQVKLLPLAFTHRSSYLMSFLSPHLLGPARRPTLGARRDRRDFTASGDRSPRRVRPRNGRRG
jgi:hypothetical protein